MTVSRRARGGAEGAEKFRYGPLRSRPLCALRVRSSVGRRPNRDANAIHRHETGGVSRSRWWRCLRESRHRGHRHRCGRPPGDCRRSRRRRCTGSFLHLFGDSIASRQSGLCRRATWSAPAGCIESGAAANPGRATSSSVGVVSLTLGTSSRRCWNCPDLTHTKSSWLTCQQEAALNDGDSPRRTVPVLCLLHLATAVVSGSSPTRLQPKMSVFIVLIANSHGWSQAPARA